MMLVSLKSGFVSIRTALENHVDKGQAGFVIR